MSHDTTAAREPKQPWETPVLIRLINGESAAGGVEDAVSDGVTFDDVTLFSPQ